MKLIPKSYYYDDFFDDFFAPMTTRNNDMKCDIYEKDNTYHIEIDIPGFDKKDINIEENNGYLTITAEKSDEVNEEEKNYIRRERNIRKYQRQFYLGDMAAEKIKAEFKDGLLKLSIPKLEQVETKKTIEIE